MDEKIDQNTVMDETIIQDVGTDEKSVKIWKRNRKIAMDEKLVENHAMDEK